MTKPHIYEYEAKENKSYFDFKTILTGTAIATLIAISAPEVIHAIDYDKTLSENKIYFQQKNFKNIEAVASTDSNILEPASHNYIDNGVVIPEELSVDELNSQFSNQMPEDLSSIPNNEAPNIIDLPQETIDTTKDRILKQQMPERVKITMNYMIDDLKSLYKINKYVPQDKADKVATDIVTSIILGFEASHPNDDKKIEKILAYYSQMVNECSGDPTVRGDNKQSIGIYQVQAKALPYVFRSYKRYLNEYKWIKPNNNKNFIAFSQLLSTLVEGGINKSVDYDKLTLLCNNNPLVSDFGIDINRLKSFKANKLSKKEVIESILTNTRFNTMATIMFNDVNKCKLENVSHWNGEKQYKALDPFLEEYGLSSSEVPIETMAAQVTHNGMTVVKNIKYHEAKNMMSYPEKNIRIYSERIEDLEKLFKENSFKMSIDKSNITPYDFGTNS